MSSPLLSISKHLVFLTSTTDSSSISTNFSFEEVDVSLCQQILNNIPEVAEELRDVKNVQGLWRAVETMINQSVQETNCKIMLAPSDTQHLLKLSYVVTKLQASSPEMLPAVLNLYMTLETFPTEEVQVVLKELRSIVKGILHGLTDLIRLYDSSAIPWGGGTHKITAYLMSYIKLLFSHHSLLDIILVPDDGEDCSQDTQMYSLDGFAQDLISCLGCTLERISKLYRSEGLQCIFLLSNVYFVLQQLQGQELKSMLQNDWILKYQNEVEQHIAKYLQYSWEPVLSCLQIRTSMLCICFNPSPIDRFNAKLEITYIEQKSWRVEDPQLRQSLRERVSSRVVQCYQAYLQRLEKHQKHVNYTPQELEKRLMELFEG